jgi:protein involved in polysaccharide export with SLBB domain/capsular polysaccharide biosynthesis protein
VPPAPANSARDFWPLALAVARHWGWLGLGAVLFAAAGALVGYKLWATRYTAVAQIIRFETPDPQLFQPRQIAAPTLASMIESVEVRARVGAAMSPPLSAEQVGAVLQIAPERSSDILNVAISGNDRAAAIRLANRYAAEAVRFTQELQAQEAGEASRYLKDQLAKVEGEIAALNTSFRALPPAALKAAATPRPTLLLSKLDEARDQLADLLARYTDAHPLVQEQRARLAALEKQVNELATRPAQAGPANPAPSSASAAEAAAAASSGDYETMRDVGKALEGQRLTLTSRLHLTQLLQQTPPGYYRMFAPAAPEHIVINRPAVKIGLLTVFAGLLGVAVAACGALTDELLDPRLKTMADVRRVTGLPVLASLGPLERLPLSARAAWAFRAWTALQCRLSTTPNHGLICGITSSRRGEGRSAWVRLLAEAANQCGFRVLTITTRPTPESDQMKRAEEAASAGVSPGRVFPSDTAALANNILSSPAEITQQLLAAEGPPVVHIPLPGWVWSLERRKEWLAALNHWRTVDNLVILVELPPASAPESVLLAQNLPNLVWLTDATAAEADETRMQLETLRQARCNIVGAVMNRHNEPEPARRFARWLQPSLAAVLVLCLMSAPAGLMAQPAGAPDAPPPETVRPAALSVESPAQRAGWQTKLTLGPGDVLRLALYGEPTLTHAAVVIQPDGGISFLEAQDVPAAGLTVDELRGRLDEALAKFRRAPRTMVAPVALHSKKYYMLGKVTQKGVFTLDRPLTVVEAVARARGFETGLSGRNVVELADLSRSFLVRGGQRAPVDFEKLFAGDLAQNIAVEPGDYFYFPPADVAEVYVLGEVLTPGPVTFTEHRTALNALSDRGGFTPRAWRHNVLVVRGSLGHPQTFVVNLADVIAGRTPDVKLQPRDIVYVSARPWIRAEDLLDEAATAFAQAVVVFWTTDKVIPVVP